MSTKYLEVPETPGFRYCVDRQKLVGPIRERLRLFAAPRKCTVSLSGPTFNEDGDFATDNFLASSAELVGLNRLGKLSELVLAGRFRWFRKT